MATIDYKEKYEQALERASKLHDNINASSSRKAWLEDIFPELKESEDERTWIINYLSNRKLNSSIIAEKENLKKAIAWLEKHKYTEDDLDKAYKCADEVQYRRGYEDAKKEIEKQGKKNMCISEATKQKLEDNLNKALEKETPESWNEFLEMQAEQKHVIFIPKFRAGDKLVSTKNPRLTYEVLEVGYINEFGNPEYKVEIFTDGKVSNPRNIHDMECYKVEEWAKLIEQKPIEEEMKALLRTEYEKGRADAIAEMQEWSEDTQQWIDTIIKDYEWWYDADKDHRATIQARINTLKSLRPQNTWKPSEEMLEALHKAIPENVIEISKDEMLLDKLYQGLKYGRVLSEN